jgi:lysozyme family protein
MIKKSNSGGKSMYFDKALEVVLKLEGGWSNDPSDPGGETNHGITIAVARQFGYTGDMRDIPMSVVKTIYKDLYWDEVRGDNLPWPLCLYVFDCAVNQGPRVARMLLQKAVDTPQDGILGNNTMAKVQKSGPWHWAKFMAYRAQRYTGTRNYDLYGTGWLTRLFEVASK